MPRQHRSVAIGAIVCAAVCVAACGLMASGLRSLELYHDDGSAEGEITGLAGKALAVGFQAPEGMQELIAIRLFVMDDGITNPDDPQLPTTWPFTVWVWKYGPGGVPGAAANSGYAPFTDYAQCPEDVWVDIVLPEPIDISDPTGFPDGRFFVGLEWDHRNNPVVGLDLDAPVAGQTLLWDWSTWAVVDTADALLRAVVSDSSGVPVDVRSWGSVKGEYR